MLSIIIPTLNEEKYLPFLLESIKGQDFYDYEIIIADAGSIDKTLEISENLGCQVIKGGLPPEGKNKGASVANGEIILFIDADVILPEGFLQKTLKEFKKRNLDLASFYLRSENKIHDLIFGVLYNFPSRILEKNLPQAMSVLMVKRNIHQKIGGFGQDVKIGEELDYIRRAKKISNFGLIRAAGVFVSSRRFQKDGWLKTWTKYLLCQIHLLFFGPVKSDIFGYRFNHYERD